MVDLLPISVVGVHRLEIGDEVGAVERPVSEIAGQRGQPGAAEQPAEIAHRVLAVYASPVGQRRTGEHDRAGQVRADRAHHHDLPAGLAVADQTRLALGLRVPGDDLLDKARLGQADILDRLTRHRLRQEPDKITGVTGRQRDADLAVVLHAADARPVPGPRVEYDEGALAPIDRYARWRHNAD